MAEKPRYKYVRFERSSSPLPAGTTCYTIAIDPMLSFNSGASLMLMSTAGWFLVNPAAGRGR